MSEFTTGAIKPLDCLSEAWTLVKDSYLPLLLIVVLGTLLSGAIPIVLVGPMYCGIFYAFLRKMDTGSSEFGDLFKGFDYFKPSLVVTLFFLLPVLAALVLFAIVTLVGLAVSSMVTSNDSAIGISMLLLMASSAVLLPVVAILHVLGLFAYPLVADRGLSGSQAFRLSARAVWGNLGGISVAMLLQIAISLLGVLACGVGIYLVLPLLFAMLTVEYRKVFPRVPGVAPGSASGV